MINPVVKKLLKKYGNYEEGFLYLVAKSEGFSYPFPEDCVKFFAGVKADAIMGITPEESWIEEWNQKWPTSSNVIDAGTFIHYSPRSSIKAVEKKLKKFVKEFYKRFRLKRADWPLERITELIDKATDNYLQEKKDQNYERIMKSSNFVEKNYDSVLENYCRLIIDGKQLQPKRLPRRPGKRMEG